MREIKDYMKEDTVYRGGKEIGVTDSYEIRVDNGNVYVNVWEYHPGVLELDEEDLINLLKAIKENKSNKKSIKNIKSIFSKFIFNKKGLENKL